MSSERKNATIPFSQQTGSDDDEEAAEQEAGEDEEQEYELKLAHGFTRKGSEPRQG